MEAFRHHGNEVESQSSNLDGFQNFIKCHHAIKSVCAHAGECLKKVIMCWHSQLITDTGLNICESPGICSQVKTRPNQQSGSCDKCCLWAEEIEKATFPHDEETMKKLSWENINSSRFHDSALEVAKVYACDASSERLADIKDITDFDHGSLLTIMQTFSGFMEQFDENGNWNGKQSSASKEASDSTKGTMSNDAEYVTKMKYADIINKVTFNMQFLTDYILTLTFFIMTGNDCVKNSMFYL